MKRKRYTEVQIVYAAEAGGSEGEGLGEPYRVAKVLCRENPDYSVVEHIYTARCQSIRCLGSPPLLSCLTLLRGF
jgi:sirohydrochlorin ferrochelatase